MTSWVSTSSNGIYNYSSVISAAIIINQDDLKNGNLEDTIDNLINSPEKIAHMGNAAKSISTPNAMEIILKEINSLIC